MQNLNVQLIQTTQVWEDISANLHHFEDKLKACTGADLILLPEMFSTSFTMQTQLAEDWESSKTKNWLIQQAKFYNSAIYTSFIVKDGASLFNRGVFVEPNGGLHVYDKRKCFSLAKEDEYFSAGKERKVIEYKGWKIQLQICYDLRFPEIQRNLWNSEKKEPTYDILLFVANWPAKRSPHWTALLKARAIENQCFVLGLNRIGLDGNDFAYDGQSAMIDALGNYLAGPSTQEEILVSTLSFNDLTDTRTKIPFLKDQD